MSLSTLWAPYNPDSQAPWNLLRVVHLHRRVGRAGTWAELQRDLKDGPATSIERLLRGTGNLHSPSDFASTANLLAEAALAAGEIYRLKAWWFYRLLFGPDPLGEKLTLLWHDHFATAASKVRDVGLMHQQNETFRRLARSRFAELLNASVREPALLLFLDAQANRQGHPNENLARELMELFTLGVGNYSEGDVKEAARALTGWSVVDGAFVEVPAQHDTESKRILGRSGRWTGADLVQQLLEHPATARRLAFKLCQLFLGQPVDPAAQQALADGLRERDLDLGWAVGVIVKSQRFFAESNLGTQVRGPVDMVVGTTRMLELFDPAPSTLALADWAARIGQDLFDPPNVGGWPGHKAWLHPRGLIARANFVTALLGGANVGRAAVYDPAALPQRYGFGTGANDLLTFHHQLLFGLEPSPELRRRFAGTDARTMLATLLASPEAQLG